jgi:hypothetical protein
MPKGRTIRCKRCKVTTANSLELDGWAVDIRDQQISGYICPDCLKPGEANSLPEGSALDIGHGFDEEVSGIKGNFSFLKRKIDSPDYYGKREANMDWETLSDIIRRAFEHAGQTNRLTMKLEIQTLWNFRMEISSFSAHGREIRSTGYHTHGMKKGKQLDQKLIGNLSAMGLSQPQGDVKDWEILLTPEECLVSHLNRIIIHILERGYEFNPNLIQSIEFE